MGRKTLQGAVFRLYYFRGISVNTFHEGTGRKMKEISREGRVQEWEIWDYE